MSRQFSVRTRGARLLAAGLLVATQLAVVATASVSAAPGPNLVQNGSFEQPALPNDTIWPAHLTSPGALPGWTLSGHLDLIRCGVAATCPTRGYPWAAAEGAQSVDLEGVHEGTIRQTVATVAGHTYTLTFKYMPAPLARDSEDPDASVRWNGKKVKIRFQDRKRSETRTWYTATATVVATSGSATLELRGHGDHSHGFAIDDVSLTDNDGGPATPPPAEVAAPELLRAAPLDNGGSGFAGRILDDAGTYQVSFYAADSCDAIGFGAQALGSATVTTTAGSSTFFASLPATIPGTTPFVAARVTGPASTPGVAGKLSDFGPCVVYSPENDTWPRALDITPNSGNGLTPSSVSVPSIGNWIDQPGVARWFKVRVVPGGRVTLDLSNLPADYDVYLFRDIAQAYSQLTSTTDLVQLSAQFAGSGFAGSGFAGSGFAGSGFAGSGFAGSGFAGSGFAPDEYSGSGFAGSGFAGSGFAGSGFAGSGFAGSGFAGSGFAGSGFAGSGFAPEAFSAAQSYSLIAWGNQLYLADEHVEANTWTSTGDFYIRVNGKNGASSLTQPFTLTVNESSSVCLPVAPIGSAPSPIANSADTLILTDSSHFGGADTTAMMTSLGSLAAATNGVVVDLAGNARVQQLQAQAAANGACVYAENLVASAIKDVVAAFRAGNTGSGLKYVVLAGGDNVIPFFRYPDTASLGPELNFYPPVLGSSAAEAALRSNYVLGQDAYGSSHTFAAGPVEFPIPDLPVGRLVESPAQIASMVAAYLGQPVLTPQTSFVSGYDFMADAAAQIGADMAAGTSGSGAADATLISPYGDLPTDPSAWNADQLQSGWLDTRRDISFLGGHFNASAALAADLTTTMDTADLLAAGIDLTGTLMLSIGCHSGYNIQDADGVPGVTNVYDWAQALADRGVTSIMGTGYQYGDTDFIEYSERIYANIARQLRYGTGAVAVGRALVAAKIDYLTKLTGLGDLHTKSLLETTLYGLPMAGVDLPTGRLTAPAGATPVALTAFTSEPALTTGLRYYDFTQNTPSVEHSKQLNVDTGGTLTATWYTAPDGSVQTEPGAPAIPVYSAGVTAQDPGYVLRGVGFRGGAYADSSVVPLTGAPGTEMGTAHTSFNSPTFYPSLLGRANFFDALAGGDATSLMVLGAQHRATNPGSPDVLLRLYDNVSFRLFYSNSLATGATSGAPTIYGVSSDLNLAGDTVINARIVGDPSADIQQAWVTFTEPGSGLWQSIDLVRDGTDPTLWSATRHLAPGTTYMVQAVNGFGLVTLNDNLGAYYLAGIASGTAATSAILLGGATSGVYGSNASVSATLTSGGNPVAGKLVVFTLGSSIRSATTNASGVATAAVPLASAAGGYTLAATFLGDPTTMGSGATRPFTINAASSTVTVSCPASVPYTGSPQTPCGASVTGAGGLADTLQVTYSNNTNAGTATASASYPGDAAHDPSSSSVTFAIGQAASTIDLFCPAVPQVYTGSALEPCSATVTGTGGLSETLTVTYSDNVDAGVAGASASYAGDANHAPASADTTFSIVPASTSVSVSCPASVPYTGSAQEPCTAIVNGTGVVTGSATLVYSDNVATGTAGVTATYAGDSNHTGSEGTSTFAIGQATSTVTVTCPATASYTGLPLQPCTASVTGAGGLNEALTVVYGSNTNAGLASASATYAGDANHTGGSDTAYFLIGKASSSITLSCPVSVTYTGSALTPCSATVSGAGTVTGTAALAYDANVNAGTATVEATYEGDQNHEGSTASTSFEITRAGTSITLTCPGSVTYTGAALTPCSATVNGAGTVTGSATVSYDDNVNAGTASASATYAGDANHSGSTAGAAFQVSKADASVNLSCPPSVTYTGAALTPCSASPSGAGTVTGSAVISYGNNTSAGTASASASYAGDANHNPASASTTFQVLKAASETAVSCPESVPSTGSAITPCFATVTGVGGLNTVIDVTYTDNVNPGTASASATYPGDANHESSTGNATFLITPGAAAVTVTVLPTADNPTPQFGDTVTIRAALPSGSAGSVAFTFNGVNAGSATVSGDAASVNVRLTAAFIPLGAGTYTAAAAFTAGAGSTWNNGTGSAEIAVAREGQLANGQQDGSARASYTGPSVIAPNTSTTLRAVVFQGRAPEAGDTERVDYATVNAYAVFRIYPAGCTTSCPGATWTSSNVKLANGDDGRGNASVSGPRLAVGAYIVTVSVVANGYILPQVATSTIAVNSSLSLFSFAGGGTIAVDSTSNAPSTVGAFAFHVRNTFSGTPAGSGTYVYRMRIEPTASTIDSFVTCETLSATCRDVDILIRTTGITSIGGTSILSYPISGRAIGPALVQVVDAADGTTRYAALEFTDGTLRGDAYDAASTGTSDKWGLTLYRGGLPWHQAHVPSSGATAQTGTGVATNQVVLASGNIQLR